MDQQINDFDIDKAKDFARVEDSLRSFWEKAHAVSDLLSRFRSEIKSLRDRQTAIEREVEQLRADYQEKDAEIRRLHAEHSGGNSNFTAEERENLKDRIRDLLNKINSHL